MTRRRHSHHCPDGRKPRPTPTTLVYEDCGADHPPLLTAYPSSSAPVAALPAAIPAGEAQRDDVGTGSVVT